MGQHRYYGRGLYFVTFNTRDRFPYFEYPLLCELFVEELILAKQIKQFDLFAFCINYDHVHLLLGPNESVGNVSQIVQFIKRHFSRNANILLGYASEKDILSPKNVADNGYCQLNKKIALRRKEMLKQNGSIPKFVWHKSFHDHMIRNYADFYTHYMYTMENYLKHGLPDGWKYTGLRYPGLITMLDV